MPSSTTQNIGTAISQSVMPNRASVMSQANSLQAATRSQVQAANHAVAHKLTEKPNKDENKKSVPLKKEVAPTYSPQNLKGFGKDSQPQEVAGSGNDTPQDSQQPESISVTA